ncbi:hypothetical protein AB0H37_35250 [Actinomadura sp. NPDC023710]|uniref:hypothetical protein n=1 Tax=Actinomadura sp. NPDC023710 TaxID=3158219 RepID=UPI0033F7C250
MVSLDVAAGTLDLSVDAEEIQRRLAAAVPPTGYASVYVEHVLQADRGADFDFLVGRRGTAMHGENH